MFSPLRILYHFWIWPNFIHTLKSLRVHLGLIQWKQFNTIHCEEIKINMNVWLDITSEVFKGGRQIYIQMKAYVLPYHFWIWPIHSYLKEPPWRNIQIIKINMNVWLDITSEVSREADKFISKWKPMFSPLRILYHFWIWPNHSYLKEPPCTLRTHSVETIQHYTLWRNKNKYECMVGYNFRSFQGRPTNLYPNESLCSPLCTEYYIIFE